MLDGVADRFLGEAEQVGRRLGARQLHGLATFEAAPQPGALLSPISEFIERGGQAVRIDGHGDQPMGKRPHVRVGLAYAGRNSLRKLRGLRGSLVADHLTEILRQETQPGQLLLRAVVQFLTNAALLKPRNVQDLLLEGPRGRHVTNGSHE